MPTLSPGSSARWFYLTGRYLLRALAELSGAGLLPDDLAVVGVAREAWDDDDFRGHASGRLADHAAGLPAVVRDRLVSRLRYQQGDAGDAEALRGLLADAGGPVLVYLALPPSVFPAAIDGLAAAGLPDGSRIVVEKPFGTDLPSARHLNELLHQHFPEASVFRVDHFLGKQTVQNVLGLRFANRLFEPVWCAEHVESVEITWEETVALEGRAGYYDQTGALRDMVQNHLLQLLTFVAMERPTGLDERQLRDAKVALLRAVGDLDEGSVTARSARGRYTAGAVDGRTVPDYTAEAGVDPSRDTETFAEVTLTIDNDRWRGVPFTLRTGKAMGHVRREVRVRFRPVDRLPFGPGNDPTSNVLTLSMDPDRLALDVAINGAGDPFCLDPARIDVELAPQELSAYARLLLDAIEGDPSLATRGDEAEESWRIVAPILEAWRTGAVPMAAYPAGSAGPAPLSTRRSSSARSR